MSASSPRVFPLGRRWRNRSLRARPRLITRETPLAWSPDDGAPMMRSPTERLLARDHSCLGRDDARHGAGQRRGAPDRRLGLDEVAQGGRFAGRQGHAAHLAGPVEALGEVGAPLFVLEPLAVARRHFVGEDHGQGALADHVVGRHQGRVDADALVVGPAGPGVLVHPLGDPVLVAQAFLGHAPEVGFGAPVFIDGPVRAQAAGIDEDAAPVREGEGPLPGPDHGHLERLDLGVIDAARGIFGFRPHLSAPRETPVRASSYPIGGASVNRNFSESEGGKGGRRDVPPPSRS